MIGRTPILLALLCASSLWGTGKAEILQLPSAQVYEDLLKDFTSASLNKKFLESQRKQYCVSLEAKRRFLDRLTQIQESNFARLKPGTWFHYIVSETRNGKTTFLGTEKWKITSIAATAGEAVASVLDTDGHPQTTTLKKADLLLSRVRPDPKVPSTCLLQDTLVGQIKESHHILKDKRWPTLEYYRHPLGSNESQVRVTEGVPLGLLTFTEAVGEKTVLHELDTFHW
jgi:hypothetical protein